MAEAERLVRRRPIPSEYLTLLAAGQATMIAIIVGGERWHPLFLRHGAQVMPPAAFAAIARGSLLKGTAFNCGALGQSIKLLQRRDAVAANQLAVVARAGRCPQLAPPGTFPL